MNIIVRPLCALSVLGSATLTTGCFTGIESTPKISDSDVRRQVAAHKVEDTFLQPTVDSISNLPLRPGLSFRVTDNKIGLILEPAATASTISAGDTLLFTGLRPATTVDGRNVAEIHLATNDGSELFYRTNINSTKISTAGDIKIPFCNSLELVEGIRRKLIGKQLFVTTSSRYDLNNNIYTGRKYVPVTITDVQPGNTYYPIQLTLRDDRDMTFRLYLSADASSSLPRKFNSQLSLTDPRNHYPTISDQIWTNIIEGKVTQGMTRDECRLALGEADNVDRQTGYSSVREIWTYKNGRYLVFIDGVLETYRN